MLSDVAVRKGRSTSGLLSDFSLSWPDGSQLAFLS